jgi:glycosyltransferase involved in cell wall biosynthesis
MQGPFISVVIPTFNSEKFVTKTLETVYSQTYNNYEVIVSDDGSSDNTVEVVKEVFDKYGHRENKILINSHGGPGVARNKGIEIASGQWIAFLDSDDQWYQEKLQKVADYINQHKEYNVICHSLLYKDKKKIKHFYYYKNFNFKIPAFLSLYRRNALTPSSVIIKKTILVEAGLFNVELPSAQDYELWLRLSLLIETRINYIKDILGISISRENNISANIEERFRCMKKIGEMYSTKLYGVCTFPFIEERRFKGEIYTTLGTSFIKKGKLKGLYYILFGIIIWPFRVDLLKKLFTIN